MDLIIQYFLKDPLKVLYFLGGAGGITFWIEKWRDRIRLDVRVLSHSFNTSGVSTTIDFEFEVVNLGKAATSLEPEVICCGYYKGRRLQTASLQIQNDDRQLLPHATRRFNASGSTNSPYTFWLFKTYRIAPTRGYDRVIYTQSYPDKPLSRLRYEFELTLYCWGGWLPFIKLEND